MLDVLAGHHKEYTPMARKYSKSASKDVERALHKEKRGTLKSGRSGKTVTSRKQAIDHRPVRSPQEGQESAEEEGELK